MEKEIPNTEVKPTEVITPTQDNNDDVVIEEGKVDPLDTIEDVDALRAEAKKFRGIAGRKDKKETTITPEVKPQEQSQFITREELYADNRKEAARLVTEITGDDDPEKEFKTEMEENWDDVMTYFVSRRGQAKPEDIVKDVKAAYILWKHETGGSIKDNSANELQNTTIGNGSGGSQKPIKPATDTSDDRRFSKPKPPTEWYPKKD